MSRKLTYAQIMAEVMWHLVTCILHGYSQYHREGDGTWEDLVLSDNTIVTIRGGDKDCSESVRTCAEAAGLLGDYWESYMWTGNEHDVLTGAGFILVALEDAQVGDVLWREGHTELVIEVDGELMQAGFRRSETGGVDGETGDQDGLESTYSEYHPWEWTLCYRYAGPERPGAGEETPEQVEEPTITEEDMSEDMVLVQPDGKSYMVLVCGDRVHPIAHPDEEEAVKMWYQKRYHKDIDVITFGNSRDPWAKRLFAVFGRSPE